MSRYHINPKNGEPSVCRAKIRCRFGASESEHYQSKEAARSAYERKNAYNNIYSMGVIKDNIKQSVSGLNVFTIDSSKTIEESRLEFVNFIKDSGVNSFTIGRISKATPEQLEQVDSYREVARALIDRFSITDAKDSSKRIFELPRAIYYSDEGTSFGEEFTTIASGVVNNAYLHRESDMVFKVPNRTLEPIKSGEAVRRNFMVEENYEKLNQKRLSEEFGVDYAKTFFITVEDGAGKQVPVQVQEYLDPNEYEEYSFDWDFEKKLVKEFDGKLNDFHMGNVRRHKMTGKIILIDCIMD